MKYASEVRDFLAQRPGEPFCVRHIVRLIRPAASQLERTAMRRQVLRVLTLMAECGAVMISKQKTNGGDSRYAWIETTYGLRVPRK